MTLPAPHSLNDALGHTASDKRLEVLRRVGHTGSISQAARDAGISYKAAWQAIETLTNLTGLPLVDRSVGGSGGGGARITAQGQQLLALADELALARAQVLARYRQGLPGGVGAAQLGLRTSMRNQLPCVVDTLQPVGQGPMVSVVMHTLCGQALASLITRESAEMLGLVPQLPVLCLCKATAVDVAHARATHAEDGSAMVGVLCTLQGVVADVSPGPGPQEVAFTLSSGHLWVGFAPDGAGLAVGDAVCGRFAASAVVIGLGG
jgi:molybdate transport system regulatory protein